MISWRKIHQWMVKALEEPFFRAEMHRVEISLPEDKEPHLQLIEGGVKSKAVKGSIEPGGMKRFVPRT